MRAIAASVSWSGLLLAWSLELVMAPMTHGCDEREWVDDAEVEAILDKTLRLRLDPDLSGLSAGERVAVRHLLDAGERLHGLYERSLHAESASAGEALAAAHAAARDDRLAAARLDLFRLFRGPIATTLDNRRVPLADVDPEMPGRNVYPWGVTREEVDAFLAVRPAARRDVLHVRSVVRRNDERQVRADLEVLDRHPALKTLHPSLESTLLERLAARRGDAFYAVPYALAYAEELFAIAGRLHEAAAAVEVDDGDFAAYLRHRARDFLANDYEAGDAAWVTGAFENLNAQLGSYETYDDHLFGVKSFFSGSLLVRDREKSDELMASIGALQDIEEALPYAGDKKVRDNIPVGVYNVVADFGQARGTNTASILPNESEQVRKYGRTILLRYNIMTNPELFATSRATFEAAVADAHHADLGVEGNFYRTLWHEVGHYLGPAEDRRGGDLGDALQENSDLIEELKADLVSLFACQFLTERGLMSEAQLRSIQASGVLRVLQKVKPRRQQPYQTMQVMQMNYFLEHGLLSFDRDAARLAIDYDRYAEVATSMLREVLAIQFEGDKAASDRFIDRYFTWQDDLHEVIAQSARARETYRYRLVHYAALGE